MCNNIWICCTVLHADCIVRTSEFITGRCTYYMYILCLRARAWNGMLRAMLHEAIYWQCCKKKNSHIFKLYCLVYCSMLHGIMYVVPTELCIEVASRIMLCFVLFKEIKRKIRPLLVFIRAVLHYPVVWGGTCM